MLKKYWACAKPDTVSDATPACDDGQQTKAHKITTKIEQGKKENWFKQF